MTKGQQEGEGEFDSRKNRRRNGRRECSGNDYSPNGSNVPPRFELPLIFLPRVTREKGYITLRDVHVRRAFSRLPRCILLPFWLEFDSRSSEWRSRGILAATRCSRMQSRKSPLIETMSKEGNDNAVLLSLLPLFVFFSPPAVPLLRGGAHRSRLAGEKRKEFVARHRGEQYSVSVA